MASRYSSTVMARQISGYSAWHGWGWPDWRCGSRSFAGAASSERVDHPKSYFHGLLWKSASFDRKRISGCSSKKKSYRIHLFRPARLLRRNAGARNKSLRLMVHYNSRVLPPVGLRRIVADKAGILQKWHRPLAPVEPTDKFSLFVFYKQDNIFC